MLEISDAGTMSYPDALQLQRRLVADKVAGDPRDFLLFVEHPPVVTLGRRTAAGSLRVPRDELARRGVGIFDADRGGGVTCHCPGQIVGYPIVDLKRAGLGVADYLRFLEKVLIDVLARFRVDAFARKGLTGVWTRDGKIAAIGVAVRRWISFHGFALNVNNDLLTFDLIVPCGLSGESVTTMAALLAAPVDLARVKDALAKSFSRELSLCVRAAAAEVH